MDTELELLDRIDQARHDVDAIVDRLNAYNALTEAEQEDQECGAAGFAGLDDASHALTGLCGDAHNQFAVVRDLDGSLQLVYEADTRSHTWTSGPLDRLHISEGHLEACEEDDFSPLEQYGIPLTSSELLHLVDSL